MTVTLKPDLEEELMARAQAAGLSIEDAANFEIDSRRTRAAME
jgi:hypothetical protein